MKSIPLILTMCFLLECNSNQEKHKNNFDTFTEDYFQESLKLCNINANYLRDHRYNDALPNFLFPEFKEKQKHFNAFYINRLFSFEDKHLISDQILSKKMLIREMELELKGSLKDYF